MDSTQARRLAEALLDTHGLAAAGWRFEFSHGLNTLGHCCWRSRTVRLSRHFVRLNDASMVRETVLHEIAHALAGPGTGHGPIWKRHARRLGITPRATTDQARMPSGRWDMVCGRCGEVLTARPRHRRTSLKRRYHVACGEASMGRLFWRDAATGQDDGAASGAD